MKVVGITGGIGSGKSTLAKMFLNRGIPLYDSDSRAKSLMVESAELRNSLVELLGENTYLEDGSLNRAFVASIIFTDKEKLQGVNSLVHPAVFKDFLLWKESQTSPFVVKESALLFENKSDEFCDKIILVTADLELRIKRVMQRDGVSYNQVVDRIKNQMSEEEKIKKADFVLYNDGGLEKLTTEFENLYHQLIESYVY
ncbi:MAG: dephospho-CoA kinase [Flavobacteriaceae bacterium]|nr:MAG: dephospho-CoA kinase [Flavobacteriaceae bacterium]